MRTKNYINNAIMITLLLLLAVAVITKANTNSKKVKDKDGWSESYGDAQTPIIIKSRLS